MAVESRAGQVPALRRARSAACTRSTAAAFAVDVRDRARPLRAGARADLLEPAADEGDPPDGGGRVAHGARARRDPRRPPRAAPHAARDRAARRRRPASGCAAAEAACRKGASTPARSCTRSRRPRSRCCSRCRACCCGSASATRPGGCRGRSRCTTSRCSSPACSSPGTSGWRSARAGCRRSRGSCAARVPAAWAAEHHPKWVPDGAAGSASGRPGLARLRGRGGRGRGRIRPAGAVGLYLSIYLCHASCA